MMRTTTPRPLAAALGAFAVAACLAGRAGADLLVTNVGLGGAASLADYDSSGTYRGTFLTGSAGGLANPTGLAFSPLDGNLYIASLGTGSIKEFDGHTGAYIQDFVTAGAGGLRLPNAITFDAGGNLYVSSYRTATSTAGAVLEFNTGGQLVQAISSPALAGPTGLAFDPGTGNLLISSSLKNSVLSYDPSTHALSTFVATDVGLVAPAGLAFGPSTNAAGNHDLYVSNFFSQYSTDSSGNVVDTRAGSTVFHINGVSPGTGAGDAGRQNAFTPSLTNPAVVGPAGLAFNPANAGLYVSSYSAVNPTAAGAISVFDAATGSYTRTLTQPAGTLNQPDYLTFTPSGFGPTLIPSPVPEPSSWALLGLGALALTAVARRRAGLA